MTLSRLYKEQQQQQQKSGSQSPVTSGPATSSRTPPGLSTLVKAQMNKQTHKKLHKKVLSSSSLNDYFSAASKTASSDESTPLESDTSQQRRTAPGRRLPTFNRIDSYSNINKDSDRNITSSAIFARRMQSADRANKNDVDDDILQETDILGGHTHDDDVDQNYNQTLDEMKRSKRAEFYNSEDSDVDINSDDGSSGSESMSKSAAKQKVEGRKRSQSTTSSSTANEDQEEKRGGIRGILRRMTISDHNRGSKTERNNDNSNHSTEATAASGNDMESLNSQGSSRARNFFRRLALGDDDEFEHMDSERFMDRFVTLSGGGGGLAPGAARDTPQKADDEEAQRGSQDSGIPLEDLDPKDIAKGIIAAHARSRGDHSDESTLASSTRTGDSSFLAPNPDYYMRDDNDVYELQLDDGDHSFIAPPEKVRGGVLSSLLKLYENPTEASRSRLQLSGSEAPSPVGSGAVTPTLGAGGHDFDPKSLSSRLKGLTGKKKVKINDSSAQEQIGHRKTASFTDLSLLSPEHYHHKAKNASSSYLPSFKGPQRPKILKNPTSRIKTKREQAKAKITVHIAETLQRQRFVVRMCKALMLYGAPTHRLEEYLTMTARVLEIDAQFIYFPGCMIVSFGDPTTRTSEVQLVRCAQGLDLYKLHRVHRIYKKVIHDLVGVEEASRDLDDLLSKKPTFPPWACVLIYAFSSAMVTPFAFGGGWVDLPVAFGIGACVGGLQFFIAPRSNLYSNVFEVTASIVVSFIGRALGSINGANICFSAVVQGSLALILPGYIILCGSLELQSRNLVAGSVRMFYAIIYSLFLGFGITLGAALYGWIDHNATSETTCSHQISPWFRFLFVPMFTIGLGLINQARLFQLPVMLIISCSGYVVNYFAGQHFSNSTEFTAAISSFVIGVLGNLYSRVFKGIAVSAMLPAIFVQVPSGIASQSSLLAGVQNADNIVNHNGTTSSTSSDSTSGISFGITMIQVAIGISVGLFASTIAVYPFGKRSTSVFTL